MEYIMKNKLTIALCIFTLLSCTQLQPMNPKYNPEKAVVTIMNRYMSSEQKIGSETTKTQDQKKNSTRVFLDVKVTNLNDQTNNTIEKQQKIVNPTDVILPVTNKQEHLTNTETKETKEKKDLMDYIPGRISSQSGRYSQNSAQLASINENEDGEHISTSMPNVLFSRKTSKLNSVTNNTRDSQHRNDQTLNDEAAKIIARETFEKECERIYLLKGKLITALFIKKTTKSDSKKNENDATKVIINQMSKAFIQIMGSYYDKNNLEFIATQEAKAFLNKRTQGCCIIL